MSYDPILDAEIATGQFVDNELMVKIKENFDYLYGILGVVEETSIKNGSFEIDSDSDGKPDSWDWLPIGTGTGTMSSSLPMHGKYAFKFTSTGAGGGQLTSSDFIAIGGASTAVANRRNEYSVLSWRGRSPTGTIKAKITIKGYQFDQLTPTADVVIFDGLLDSEQCRYVNFFRVSDDTRWIKIEIQGAYDVTVGDCYIDDLTLTPFIQWQFGDDGFSATGLFVTNLGWTKAGRSYFSIPYLSNCPTIITLVGTTHVNGGTGSIQIACAGATGIGTPGNLKSAVETVTSTGWVGYTAQLRIDDPQAQAILVNGKIQIDIWMAITGYTVWVEIPASTDNYGETQIHKLSAS